MVDEKIKTPKVKKQKTEEAKVVETSTEKPKEEVKTETPKVEKKVEQKIVPKDIAVVNAFSRRISTKHSIAICRAIMRKTPEAAIELLEGVVAKKKAIAMRGWEIPHKKWSIVSDGMGGGARFPLNSSKEFIDIIKQLKANCDVNSVENPVITLAIANQGSRPFKREGRRGKSTHINIEAKDRNKLILERKNKK